MAIAFNGSSQYCEYAGAIRSTAPISFAAIAYVVDATKDIRTFAQYNTSGNNVLGLDVIQSSNVGERVLWYQNGFTQTAETRRESDAAAGYRSQAGSFVNYATAPVLYVDGVSVAGLSRGGAGGTLAINRTGAGSIIYGGTRYHGYGRTAEAAMWSVTLATQSMAAVTSGFCPLLVQPASLLCYYPFGGAMGDHDKDLIGQKNMTASGSPTFVEHPKVIYPCDACCC